jgi:outer membrane protein assembly factor BamB
MKQSKILIVILIALLPLTLVSCLPGGTQSAGGWAGTAIRDGIIYAGTLDGRVVALNSSTGELVWDYPIATTTTSGGLSCGETSVPTAIYTTPVVDMDMVYIGTYSGEVYALNIGDGDSKWVYPPKGQGYIGAVVGRPVIANGIIYVSSSDGNVYAVNTTNGKFKWKTGDTLADKLWTSPTIEDDTLYVSTLDGHIYALSSETGDLLDWSFEADAGFASSPVIYKNAIFTGSFDRYLYAINIGSDAPMWKFPKEEPADNWFWASPVISEGIVYAGCLDGTVYAIEAETGGKLWEFDTGKAIISSPVLLDNLLIVIDESGTMYVFNLDSELVDEAVPLKTISIDAAVRSAFCAQGGLIYIRGDDNQLYVADIGAGRVIWSLNLAIEE